VDRSIVISGAKLHRSGKRVVVIGGAIQGCQIAEFLAKHGRKVTIVDKVDTMGRGMVEAPMRAHLFMWFKKVGVTMIGGVKEYAEITDKGLTIISRDGKIETIEADAIILALPLKPIWNYSEV
jgi:pyruvate/2-oxoglutarate dehydrogenase complex dihydrolipoamide dehydrogenase (E3) component